MKTLNVRFAVILLVSAAVFGGAVMGLHRIQVRRNAGFFLDQAEKAMQQAQRAGEQAQRASEAGEPVKQILVNELRAYTEAAEKYRSYLAYKPDDTDVLEKLGLLQADLFQKTINSTNPRDPRGEREETVAKARGWLQAATGTLERVLRQERDADRPLARRKLVDIYTTTRRYSDAEAHLTALLRKSPKDGELLELLGRCQVAARQTDKAEKSFREAIDSAPDRIDAYTYLAGLLADRNRLNRPSEADQCMKELLEKNPDSFQAHLAYARYLASLTSVSSVDDARRRPIFLDAMVPAVLARAVERAVQALELAEDDPDALLLSKKRPVLVQVVRDALKRHDANLALDDPNALLLAARRVVEGEAPGPAALTQARDQALKALQSEEASDDGDVLSAAAKHGVLVDAMKRALNALRARAGLISAAKDGLLEKAVEHALEARQLVAGGRHALALAGKSGVLVEAIRHALKTEDDPTDLRLTAKRKVLVDAVKQAIQTLDLPEDNPDARLLAEKDRVLVDAMKRAFTEQELISADRDALMKAPQQGILSAVVKRAIKAHDSVLEDHDRLALLLAAQYTLWKREYDRASEYAKDGEKLYPTDYRMYSTSSDIQLRAGEPKAAINSLRRGLKATSRNLELLSRLTGLLLEEGEIQEAWVYIRELQKAGYPAPRVGFLQARAEYQQGEWLAAVEGRNRKALFATSSKPQGELEIGVIPKNLRLDFQNRQISLSDNPSVSTEEDGRWIIVDKGAVYEVRRQGSTLNVSREATLGFEQIRGGLAASPSLLKQADYWAGRCYGQLGNVDQELKAYRRALDTDPFYRRAKAGLAAALAKIGQIDPALDEYRGIVRMDTAAMEHFWPQLAEALLRKNLELDPSERDWRELKDLFDRVGQITPDSPQLVAFRANLLLVQAQQQRASPEAQQLVAKAEQLLLEARKKNPKELDYWTALAKLAERKKEWDQAELLLDEARQKIGDSVALRLARALYLSNRYGKETSGQLKELAENTEKFSEADRLQLWSGLGTRAERVGDDQQAMRLLRRVAEKSPNNLQIRLQLLDLAFRSGDDAGIKETLVEVEKVQGKGPHWRYGEALRLRLLAKGAGDPLLNRALKHLAQARKSYPTWPPPVVLAAQIYLRQGKASLALQDYLRAINQMGSRRPTALFPAADLLYRHGRYAEAAKMVSLLEDQQIPIPDEGIRLVRDIKFRAGDLDGALELASKAATDSDDYRNHFSLARIRAAKALSATSKGQTEEARQMFDEAEQSLRRVVDLAEEVPETWVELIRFLAGTGQPKKAANVLEQARGKIPSDQLPLALAQSYEYLGQPELAEQNCEEALAAAPQDPAVARYVADFYLRKAQYPMSEPIQRSEAILQSERILDKIIGGEVKGNQADVIWARRRLAQIFGARGGYQNSKKAINLIEQNLAAAGPSAEDLRIKANILANDPVAARRQEAARILKNLPSQTPQDRFIEWQLYLAEGAWAKASDQMRSLLADHGDQPLYVAAYVDALLEHNETQDAELWLARLEEIAPNWFSPRDLITTTSFRAELLFQHGQYVQALDLLNRFVGKSDTRPADEAERSRLVALNLEQFARRLRDLGQEEPEEMAKRFILDAETLYRKYVRQRPGQEWFLVLFLGRQDRIEEALRLLESIWSDSDPVTTAAASTSLLGNPAATPEQLQRMEKVLQAALKRFDRPIPLLLVLAQACASQERYAEAEAFYREVIRKNSRAFRAMNNLAVMLALQKTKLPEALKLANQAIRLAGPAAPLLDSRATVYMALGQPQKALDDLKKAIADQPTPVRCFHQARAYQQSGQREAARNAMKKAQQLGLQAEMLEPLERPAYKRLLKSLK